MKWYDEIAFSNQVETDPDVWEEKVVTKMFMGDLIKARKNDDQSVNINTDISVNNQLSIVMDPFLQNNFHNILYVKFFGAKWTVGSVEVQYPRLLITFGKLYKEESDGQTEG